MPDREPERKKKPDAEPGAAKPTQDRPAQPKFDLPQQGPEHLPAAPQPEQPNTEPPARANAPELDRATGDETRRAAGGGEPIPTDMRGWLNRIDRIDQPGDISDEEARRLAGLANDDGEPRPVEQENLPALVRRDVANISHDLQAAGMVNPKWHSVANLPGFQDRNIRGMGQDVFGAFTRTAHQDILTISTRANSEREVKAVLAWLKKNAEEQEPADMDYSGYGPEMGQFKPLVKEYSTANTRFHVVHDRAGWYIYAYPEADVRVPGEQANQLDYDQGSSDEVERDEYGAPIKRLKEGTQMKFSTISEQIRHLANKLTMLEESALLDSILDEAMTDVMLDESTLAKLLGQTPGANSLVHALHSRHKLASGGLKNRPGSQNVDPNYEEVPDRLHAQSIKASKDNFAIIVGTNGVAGVKPVEQDWDRSRSKELDNTMRYILVWATADHPAETEIQKFRLGRRDATGGASGMEGGAPNLFQVLRDRIGPTVSVYRATGAVERNKMATRADYKKEAGATVEQVAEKIKPVLAKLLQQTVGQLGPRIQRLAQGGNYDAVEKLTRAGKKLQAMLTALDSPSPEWTGWRTPLGTYGELIRGGINELTQGMDEAGKAQFMNNAAHAQANELGQLLNYLRAKLFTISE